MVLKSIINFFRKIGKREKEEEVSRDFYPEEEKPKVRVEEYKGIKILRPTDVKTNKPSSNFGLDEIVFIKLDNYDDSKEVIKSKEQT